MYEVGNTSYEIRNWKYRMPNFDFWMKTISKYPNSILGTLYIVLGTTFLILDTSYLILFPNNLHFPNTTLYLLLKWKTQQLFLLFLCLHRISICCIVSIIPPERKTFTPHPGAADDRDSASHQPFIHLVSNSFKSPYGTDCSHCRSKKWSPFRWFT